MYSQLPGFPSREWAIVYLTSANLISILCCFQSFAIKNSASVNSCVHVTFHMQVSLWSLFLEVELQGQQLCVYNLYGHHAYPWTWQITMSGCLLPFPPVKCDSDYFLTPLPRCVIRHWDVCSWWTLCLKVILICTSSILSAKHLFMFQRHLYFLFYEQSSYPLLIFFPLEIFLSREIMWSYLIFLAREFQNSEELVLGRLGRSC